MSKSGNLYCRHRFPPEVISHAVWLYYRFTLSFRDIEEILAVCGVQTSYESIRRWCLIFPRKFTKSLRKRQGNLSDIWYLDEVFITVSGKRQYLWRAVDVPGEFAVKPRWAADKVPYSGFAIDRIRQSSQQKQTKILGCTQHKVTVLLQHRNAFRGAESALINNKAI